MSTRREFISTVVSGAATLAVSGSGLARRVLGANDRVRLGLIGAGGRGQAIFKAAIKCPNTEAVAVADVYTRRLDEVKKFVPQIKTYQDFRRLLDDKSVDAVLIASPQHIHALNFVPAIQAGKDIFQEKTMAFNPDHAKRMRAAMKGSNRIVQVGIQSVSGPAVPKVKELVASGKLGKITQLHTHHYRNAPYGGWKRDIPADCTPANVDWAGFQGETEKRAFDPNRVINWRFYWDYSGGNVYENMVHQVGFWCKVLDLQIPNSVTMTGGNYLSPEMQVPDIMDVSMQQGGKLLFTWNSMFGNNYFGEGDDLLLGDKGTIHRNESEVVTFMPQGDSAQTQGPGVAPDKAPDIVDGNDATQAHMQNFIDCVRSRKEPNCPLEIGFRSAVACRMAITSYREGRTVRWDPKIEDIV
jgi:predicted dehydrogenase